MAPTSREGRGVTTPVTLSWREVRYAALVGVDVRLYNMSQRHTERWRAPLDETWQREVTGAIAEYAVAKVLDRHWSTAGKSHGRGDVGDLEVRATERTDGSLILHPSDPDDAPFVLVVGCPPTLGIAGWLRGGEGKVDRWWRTDVRSPAYFVPQSALRPLAELVEVRS
jgi:hypothetical protein